MEGNYLSFSQTRQIAQIKNSTQMEVSFAQEIKMSGEGTMQEVALKKDGSFTFQKSEDVKRRGSLIHNGSDIPNDMLKRELSKEHIPDILKDTSRKRWSDSSTGSAVDIWSAFVRKKDGWDYSGNETNSSYDAMKAWINDAWRSVQVSANIARMSPLILLSTLFLFVFLFVLGGSILLILRNNHVKNQRDTATDYANLMGTRISRKLDDSILPLFTLSQFVQNLDTFKQVPFDIGNLGDEGARPPVNGGKSSSHRNITGICDDPALNGTFVSIASNIKKDAKLEGILVNVQLAPSAVVCFAYPEYNTEDFEDGKFLDNSGAIGHDLLNDPNRAFISQATIPAYPEVVIAGPLTLIQNGTPTVKEALIARRAIYIDGYNITLPNGESYPCWGFAVVLLNWEKLKKASGMLELAQEQGLEFNLTRTDQKFDENGDLFKKVVTIGASENPDILNEDNSVFVELSTTNNMWKMTVGYKKGFEPEWFNIGLGLVLVLASLFCALFTMILIIKKKHQILLYKMMPKKIISKLQRGQTVVERYNMATIFFSDIVGFTTLSGNMSAFDVMTMLNELYTEFDRLVQKHEIYKVETIGDAYIVIGGGPDNSTATEGAERVALFALDVMEYVKKYHTKGGTEVFIRAGIGSGPVVAGVVGTTMPKFTLFGDTVNFSSRMESTGKKMKIQCNDMTQRLLQDAPTKIFSFEERRDGDEVGVFVKGKGRVHTWWVNGAKQRKRDSVIAKETMQELEAYFDSSDHV